MRDHPIKVLVVDDSAVSRMQVMHLLQEDPEIAVIGSVADGRAALDFMKDRMPEVVLMDIHMPGMDGFETTRRIMETCPVPIIICTASLAPREVAVTFRVLEAGAVACVEKPVSLQHPDFGPMAAHIRQTVKLMSEVKVVRRWARGRPLPPPGLHPAEEQPAAGIKLIAIGASTGGPPVLQTILAGLPKDFSVPILVVQHIATGFLAGLAEWLDQTTGFRIQIAAYGVAPLPGHVYLAPDGFHMGVSPGGRILLTKEEPESGLRPAVSYLFRTMAKVHGPAGVGVLLTGMGRDGAVELKLMRDRGAVTIAQDRESSIIHGMPGAAIELDAASRVVAADQIANVLVSLVGQRNGKGN